MLSSDLFDCFNVDNIHELDEPHRILIADRFTDALVLLLKAIGYHHRVRAQDIELRDGIRKWARDTLTIATGRDEYLLRHTIDMSASVSEYFYPLSSYETKIHMATASAAAFTVDDATMDPETCKEVEKFSQNIWRGMPQQTSWCRMYADIISGYAEYFGENEPFLGNLGSIAWTSYITANSLENRLAKDLPTHFNDNTPYSETTSACTDLFAPYFRSLTGFAAAYAVAIFKPSREVEIPLLHWVATIPHLITFLNIWNDLLSFPKETIVGETCNFISLTTKARRLRRSTSNFVVEGGQWTLRDTLCEAFEQALSSTQVLDNAFMPLAQVTSKGLRAGLEGVNADVSEELDSGKEFQSAARLWTSFKQGYIAWHIQCPRYKLNALQQKLREKPHSGPKGSGRSS
ncbi:uncharacterized protein ATNIH1004_009568 [Aspergillus tanneri]|nr:uncharacterized protein ATNIH1004_009568 [Aspergillus tanneri]KAA8642816.1 hypothetical protein ATNIH1004_009568 [Aspergillus tanneri]